MNFAGAVRGDDHDRRLRRLDDAEFGNRDLEVGQDFEQERLESLVGAVDLVDQQHRRAGHARLHRLQKRPLDEIALREDVVLDPLLVVFAGRLGEPDRHHLRRIVPLVDGGGDVEALVALQTDEPAVEGGGEDLGDLRLADPGFAFEKQRPPQSQGEKEDGRQRAVGDVMRTLKQRLRLVDRGRDSGS